MSKPNSLIQGTLAMLILKTLARQPMHGWAIMHRIRQTSGNVLLVYEAALYPTLHRLEQQGWIRSEWRQSENHRRVKNYSLTHAGKRFLEKEEANWDRLALAIGLVLKTV